MIQLFNFLVEHWYVLGVMNALITYYILMYELERWQYLLVIAVFAIPYVNVVAFGAIIIISIFIGLGKAYDVEKLVKWWKEKLVDRD